MFVWIQAAKILWSERKLINLRISYSQGWKFADRELSRCAFNDQMLWDISGGCATDGPAARQFDRGIRDRLNNTFNPPEKV